MATIYLLIYSDVILHFACFYDYEVKELNHSDEKWIKYFLSCKEIELMRKLRNNVDIVPTTDLFEINVGLVSGVVPMTGEHNTNFCVSGIYTPY